jgi:hypothetical protein
MNSVSCSFSGDCSACVNFLPSSETDGVNLKVACSQGLRVGYYSENLTVNVFPRDFTHCPAYQSEG